MECFQRNWSPLRSLGQERHGRTVQQFVVPSQVFAHRKEAPLPVSFRLRRAHRFRELITLIKLFPLDLTGTVVNCSAPNAAATKHRSTESTPRRAFESVTLAFFLCRLRAIKPIITDNEEDLQMGRDRVIEGNQGSL